MKVLITGTSKGIGRCIALKFLKEGYSVIGFDVLESSINNPLYKHYIVDVRSNDLPEIDDVYILINNAGIQSNTMDDIDVNLKGLINICEKYAFQKTIKSIVNLASVSGTNGCEFPIYSASKGGVLSYTKNLSGRLNKATVNSISFGGVITESNNHVIQNDKLYRDSLNETIMGKWISEEECAEWVYFLTVINKSMTGQDIIIDNGEIVKSNFVW